MTLEEIIKQTDGFEKTYDKMVYLALVVDNELSMKQLSEICICSEKAIRNSLKRLEEKGRIRTEKRKTEYGSNLPNKYHIL